MKSPFSLRAFRNLSVEARVVMSLRFIAIFLSFVCTLLVIVGPLMSSNFYMCRIDCAHLDVAMGIYKSLRSSVSEFGNFGASEDFLNPVDSSLTKSEIAILTKYAEAQVADAPQFYLTCLWSWCYGNYNITLRVDDYGVQYYTKHDTTITCIRSNVERLVFDYRGDLDDLGMESVLSYAYQTPNYIDNAYKKQIRNREKQFRLVLATIFGQAFLLAVMFIFQYVMYSSRGPNDKDLSNLPHFLPHTMSALSVLSVICGGIAAAVITSILSNVRSEMGRNLKDFGIDLHFGSVWFSFLWLSFGFSLVTFVIWGIPTWCANPPDKEADAYMRPGDFKSRNPSGLHRQRSVATQFSSNSTSSNPRDKLLYASSDSEDESDPFAELSLSDRRIVFDYRDEEENKLRKLGESLSRLASVRQLSKRSIKRSATLPTVSETMMTREETKKVIYNDQPVHSPFPHYMTDSYNGYFESKNASSSETESVAPQLLDSSKHFKTSSLHTKNITNNNPFLNPDSAGHSENESILEEHETNLLDQSNYFNRL